MLSVLLLLLFGKLQDVLWVDKSEAWHWACVYASVNMLLANISGVSIVAFVLSGLLLFLYAWGYLAWLRRLSDAMGMWLLVYLLGAVMPIILIFSMVS